MHQVLKNIRNIRKLKGISQEYMAEQLEITQSTYSRFEKGNKKLDLIVIHKIATILEMEVDMVFSFHKTLQGETVYRHEEKPKGVMEGVEDYRKKEAEYEKQIEVLKEKIGYLEQLYELLNIQLKDKEEIISLLKAGKKK